MEDVCSFDNNEKLELLDYRLNGVQKYYSEDFGEDKLSAEIDDDFYTKISDPQNNKIELYNDFTHKLYVLLITKNLSVLDKRSKSPLRIIIDFHEITHKLPLIKNKLKNTQSVVDLKKIYLNDVRYLQRAYSTKKNVMLGQHSVQILIGLVILLIGMLLQSKSDLF